MNTKYAYINKQDYSFSNIQENIEMVVYSLISFAIPFFIGHPQLLVGVIVNAALMLGALNLKSYKILPVILLPSLAVLTRGLLFGAFTPYLLFMIPFIWIGNSILVFAFKKFNVHKRFNKWLVLLGGAGAKTLFLFGIAFVFVKFGTLPAVFLTAMGLFQFYTAIAGGVLALGSQFIKKKLS